MDSILRLALDFVQPLCLVWLLLSVWIVRMAWLRLWRWSLLPVMAWLVLTVISATALPSWLMYGLESRYEIPSMESLSGADAIVCLGGGATASLTEPTGIHLQRGADRLSTALSMAFSNMAPALVIGGGGREKDGKVYSEADALVAHFRKFAGKDTELISLGVCANTYDEAQKVAELAAERGWQKVILVTSASHLPRAVATFAKAGVPVLPMPCHYTSGFNRISDMEWLHLPHAESIVLFQDWLHEIVGTWTYQRRGWM